MAAASRLPFPIMPRFTLPRQMSKSIQLDPSHSTINFVDRNNGGFDTRHPRVKAICGMAKL